LESDFDISLGVYTGASIDNLSEVAHLSVDSRALQGDAEARRPLVFTTHVGVGKSCWPTPRGECYVRDRSLNSRD